MTLFTQRENLRLYSNPHASLPEDPNPWARVLAMFGGLCHTHCHNHSPIAIAKICLSEGAGLDPINCRSRFFSIKYSVTKMTPKFPEMHLGHFWSKILGFYPSPLDVKNLSIFFEAIPKSLGLDSNNCRSSFTTGCSK